MDKVREDSGWQPEWNESFRGWAANFIRKNRWKLEQVYEFEDLLQDAYLTFRRVRASYPRVTEPKHFMALFKTAMNNEFIDRARYKQIKSQSEASLDEDALEYLMKSTGTEANEGYLRIALAELPPEAKLVLAAYNNPERLEVLRQRVKRTNNRRENLNMKLCRL